MIGFLVGYWILFGLAETIVFLVCFFFLSLVVHVVYRMNSKTFTWTWLDFVVETDENGTRAKSIGIYYYTTILLNAFISILLSQVLVE